MGNTSRAQLVWDGDASKAVSALQILNAKQRELTKEMRATGEAAAKGSKKALAHLKELASQSVKNEAGIKSLNMQLRKVDVSAGGAGKGMGKLNSMMGQAVFAVDDFVTVLNQPGMGMNAALRAAGNNVSFLLFQVNPLLALLPALGMGAVAAGKAFASSGSSIAKSEENLKSYKRTVEATLARIKELRGEQEDPEVVEGRKAQRALLSERAKAESELKQARMDLKKIGALDRQAATGNIWERVKANAQLTAMGAGRNVNIGGAFVEGGFEMPGAFLAPTDESVRNKMRGLLATRDAAQSRIANINARLPKLKEAEALGAARRSLEPISSDLTDFAKMGLEKGGVPTRVRDELIQRMMRALSDKHDRFAAPLSQETMERALAQLRQAKQRAPIQRSLDAAAFVDSQGPGERRLADISRRHDEASSRLRSTRDSLTAGGRRPTAMEQINVLGPLTEQVRLLRELVETQKRDIDDRRLRDQDQLRAQHVQEVNRMGGRHGRVVP